MGRLREQAAGREDELKAEIAHIELMAQQYNETMGQLREQAASRDAKLAQRIEEHSVALLAKEKEVLELWVTLTEAQERILREAERNSQREQELFAETEEIRRQHREWKETADEFMLKWRITEDERAKLADAYTELQAEGIITRARLQDAWSKEVEVAFTQLTKCHEQALTLANTFKQKKNKTPWSAPSDNTKKTPKSQGRNWKPIERKPAWTILASRS